jgi:hypothetical protein
MTLAPPTAAQPPGQQHRTHPETRRAKQSQGAENNEIPKYPKSGVRNQESGVSGQKVSAPPPTANCQLPTANCQLPSGLRPPIFIPQPQRQRRDPSQPGAPPRENHNPTRQALKGRTKDQGPRTEPQASDQGLPPGTKHQAQGTKHYGKPLSRRSTF